MTGWLHGERRLHSGENDDMKMLAGEESVAWPWGGRNWIPASSPAVCSDEVFSYGQADGPIRRDASDWLHGLPSSCKREDVVVILAGGGRRSWLMLLRCQRGR